MRHVVTSLATALSILLSGACAQNAVLEVELDLPAGPADESRLFVFTQTRDSGYGFEEDWRDGDDLGSLELSPGERTMDHISVVSTNLDTDLVIRVRFCGSEDCVDIGDDAAPERRYHLEHPFYVGERTRWRTVIEEIPMEPDTTPTRVDTCQIAGCIDGPIASYCSMRTGRHLCAD